MVTQQGDKFILIAQLVTDNLVFCEKMYGERGMNVIRIIDNLNGSRWTVCYILRRSKHRQSLKSSTYIYCTQINKFCPWVHVVLILQVTDILF